MNLTTTNSDNALIVKLQGNLDTLAAEEIMDQIKDILDSDTPITIDCTDLEYISSSGLRVLLMIRKAQKAKGNNVTMLSVNTSIMEVLRITHFDKMFEIK